MARVGQFMGPQGFYQINLAAIHPVDNRVDPVSTPTTTTPPPPVSTPSNTPTGTGTQTPQTIFTPTPTPATATNPSTGVSTPAYRTTQQIQQQNPGYQTTAGGTGMFQWPPTGGSSPTPSSTRPQTTIPPTQRTTTTVDPHVEQASWTSSLSNTLASIRR